MIHSFADKETESVWNGARSRRLPPDIQQTARRKLAYLHRARALEDPRLPLGNRLEALQGRLKGRYSVRVNNQWRITFRWVDGDAHDVRIEDYH